MGGLRISRTRSWLFTPATRPDRFGKAADAGADVVILDLEDAVAPSDKAAARRTAFDFLARRPTAPGLALRMNGVDTLDGMADIQALGQSDSAPDYLIVPKVETVGHLLILERWLSASAKAVKVVGIIESALGLANIEQIATSSSLLTGLMLGGADMSADLGAATSWDGLLYARGRLISACALGGLTPIDSPYFNLKDIPGLELELGRATELGFRAKAAIHPNQVSSINAALTPSQEAIDCARRILAENIKGVGSVDGQMIDEAVARKARAVLVAAGLVI